jgi:hypothetical protein
MNREDEGKRKYILVEMGNYFETILKPRIMKTIYSAIWDSGKPLAADSYVDLLKQRIKEIKKELGNLSGMENKLDYEFHSQRLKGEINNLELEIEHVNDAMGSSITPFYGSSHCFKYLRLESYEDVLNNLRFDHNQMRDQALSGNQELREDYMLRYMLDIESRGSQSLLNIDAFSDPTAYTLKVKKPGSDEYTIRNVDLLETFNYLIGLRVNHIAAPQSFTAKFKREKDPELPEDQDTRLVIDGRIKQDTNGLWWFRKVEGPSVSILVRHSPSAKLE